MFTHRCYVTPRSFLDLLGQYAHLLAASRTELGDKRRRLLDGIAKLNETSSTLTAMRSQLNELQPLLAEKTAATSTLLQQVCYGAVPARSTETSLNAVCLHLQRL
jgi:dynein heavy chain